jgi:hypothetical protein
MPVRTATHLAVESVLSAEGQGRISRVLIALYAAPRAVVTHAEARASLIPTPVASFRIGLRDFLVLGDSSCRGEPA